MEALCSVYMVPLKALSSVLFVVLFRCPQTRGLEILFRTSDS
jgi:hypothetical protein